ncbi:MAG TPA: hypothetical protein VIP11_06115 [Gemmatimonadaceae bacterium]
MTPEHTSAIPPEHVSYRPTPESRPRLIVDGDGVEWEVYDESAWSIELALDWEFQPQTENPGLIFSSQRDRRRLWPCPEDWKRLEDSSLIGLLNRARSLY